MRSTIVTLLALSTTFLHFTVAQSEFQLQKQCDLVGKGWTQCGTTTANYQGDMIDLNGDGAETTNDSEDSSDSTPELEPPNNDFLEGVDQLVEDLGQIGKKAKRDSNSIDSIALGVMPAKQPSLIERAILFKRQELPFCCAPEAECRDVTRGGLRACWVPKTGDYALSDGATGNSNSSPDLIEGTSSGTSIGERSLLFPVLVVGFGALFIGGLLY